MDKPLSEFNKKLKTAMGMKEISKPRMTVNKLGEFLTATSPKRQRKILETLKYPKEHKFTFTGYNEARNAINGYILDGFNEQILLDWIQDFENKTDDERDNFTDSTIEALTILPLQNPPNSPNLFSFPDFPNATPLPFRI